MVMDVGSFLQRSPKEKIDSRCRKEKNAWNDPEGPGNSEEGGGVTKNDGGYEETAVKNEPYECCGLGA
jgi:hypothetical protein